MKICIVLFAVVGLSYGFALPEPVATRGLEQDVQDFLALIPVDKVKGIVKEYIANDAEVQKIVAYLKSDKFKTIVTKVAAIPEVREFVRYLEGKGLHVVEFLNKLADLLGLPHVKPQAAVSTRGLHDMTQEILDLVPLDKVLALFYNKLETSKDFAEVIQKITDSYDVFAKIAKIPEVIEAAQKLRDMGVDVDGIIDFIKSFFGWGGQTYMSTRGLSEDVADFLKLIPVDKIKGIVQEYIANDKEVQKVVAYLKGPEFAKFVNKLVSVPEIKEFVHYLESKGLNVIELLNKLADLLGLPHFPTKSVVSTRGWRDMFEEISALVPLDKVLALFYDKMENSKDFSEVFEKLAGSQALFEKVLKFPEVIELGKKLRELGVDLDVILDFIRSLFGWDSRAYMSTRGLSEDVADFLKLIPVDKIKGIVQEYIANDKEVQKVVAYLKGPEFAKLVNKFISVPEIKEFVHYLEGKGLNVIELLNKLADLLGLPHFPTKSTSVSTRGWRDMFEEIQALVPLDKVIALFFDKMENSKDFAEVFEKLAGTQDLFEKVIKFPEFIELGKKLRELGVDVDVILDFIRSLFGWDSRAYMSTRGLTEDFFDFLELIPVNKIQRIIYEYIENDKEVKEIFAYLRGPEFAKVVDKFASIPEVKEFVHYLENKGVDVIQLLNYLADLLGLPHFQIKSVVSTRGLPDMIQEIQALIPLDKVIALFYYKLGHSNDFAAVFHKLGDSQDLFEKVLKFPEVIEMGQKLRELGVDIDVIIDFIRSLFGW